MLHLDNKRHLTTGYVCFINKMNTFVESKGQQICFRFSRSSNLIFFEGVLVKKSIKNEFPILSESIINMEESATPCYGKESRELNPKELTIIS